MTLRILYFGPLGDIAGCDQVDIPFEPGCSTIADLREHLGRENAALAKALAEPQVMVALNQQLVDWDCNLKKGDEVAFLPPVTGG